jgi:hypothetical protein
MPYSQLNRPASSVDEAKLSTVQPALAEGPIRQALLRISSSGAFIRSPQLITFLSFIVEEELAGRGERLKGYTIGVHALGRSKDFDPNADPIVRVEARRLRLALKSYYAFEGLGDNLVIDLPVGSYRPTIRMLQPETTEDEAEPPPPVLSESHAAPLRAQPAEQRPNLMLKIILATVVLNQVMLWVVLLMA